MAGVKVTALPAGIVPVAADPFPSVQSSAMVKVTASQIRQYVGEGLSNAALATLGPGYAADTYMTGTAITIPTAGGWRAGSILKWQFDMTKTAAGTATPIITVRMGTLGTTGDASVYTFTFAAGTAVADTGIFDVTMVFRSVGSGTSAVIAGYARCTHLLAATGLTSTGASGVGILVPGASSGFNSTTQTIIGLSFNGGTSFAGTQTVVIADADNL